MPMILGEIGENERKIKLDIDIRCNNCGKNVPGGLKVGENYSQTEKFKNELKNFLGDYLCGICRDESRVKKD
jgi:hypothetical protein